MLDDDMLAGFLDEAREHLMTVEPDLLTLEETPTDMDVINRLFRNIHSIKGGAGFFGLDNIGSLSHVMENLMSKARNSKIVLDKDHIDGLLKGIDKLSVMIDDVSASNELDIADELALLEKLTSEKQSSPSPEDTKPEPETATPPPVEESTAPESAGTEDNESRPPTSGFKITKEELESIIAEGMNVYAISVYLNRDITGQGKTPFQFISELEEFGRFIDSYLDVESAPELDEILEDDLRFIFAFATLMEPDLAANVLGVSPSQFSLIDLEDFEGTHVVDTEPEESKEEVVKTAQTAAVTKAPTVTKAAAPKNAEKVVKAAKSVAKVKAEENIRVSITKLNKLVNLAGELVLVRNQLLQAGEKVAKTVPGLMSIMGGLNNVTTELQEEILNTRMQPISTVFGKFPRLIRELGKTLGKEIQLITEGNEVELDKTVLEALSDPLTHIIRNTADHGIELPEERKAKGKRVQGKLLLKAYHESGQVIIHLEDDGKGIDPQFMANKAFEKGLISEENLFQMTDREKANLIFMVGFSTADQLSSVSGRGVGMDVVRSNIEKIGGTVELQSVVNKGTTIRMNLPLTMAIVSCLIVETEKERFAIPQINLEELVMLKPNDFNSMLGNVQDMTVLKLRGELLPLVSLSQGLGIHEVAKTGNQPLLPSPELEKQENMFTSFGDQRYFLSEKSESQKQLHEAMRILIVSVGVNKVGIIVDSIVGSEEIVVKPMPEFIKQLGCFSGCTILGDGTVAMIIDTLGFVQSNKLFITAQGEESYRREESTKSVEEEQSLLIFDNGTDEQFALTIPLIQRVDEISLDQIQKVGTKEYIEYRKRQLRILYLADYLPIQKPEYKMVDTLSIIIPKETRIPVGILIHKVIDTKSMLLDITQGSVHADGILGSTLIDGKITLLLDLYAILEMGEPDSLHRVEFEPKVVESSAILLIEDTPLFQNIVKEYLHSVGFHVTVAADGQLGLDELNKNDFDIVLCDIEMPVLDGFGVIHEVRSQEKWKDLPMIALTSLNDEETIKKGMAAGFDDWLIKLDKQKILECINKYL